MLKFKDYKLRLLEVTDNEKCIKYYIQNRDHLTIFETIKEEFFNAEYWKVKIENNKINFFHRTSFCSGIFCKEELIGLINFTNIIYGGFYSCFLGYSIDCNYQGKGIMKGSIQVAIDYLFTEFNLHRISANYMINNERSAALLNSLGFKKDGVAPNYLRINGKWEDHILTSLINDKWKND